MMQSEKSRFGGVFVLLAAVCWGTSGTAQALAPEGFDPLVIGTLRLALGGVAMLVVVLLQGGFNELKGWPLKQVVPAAAFTALYQACFFAAVDKTGVIVGTIVGIGSAPVAGGLLGYLFRGERPGRYWFMATLLSMLGCGLLTLGSRGEVLVDPVGVALAVGAGFAYAAYALTFKGLLERNKANTTIAIVFCVGALLLAPVLIGRDLTWLLQPRGIGVALYLGLVTAALAYWLFARGLRQVPVATAMTLTLAEPMMAALLGFLVLGEKLTPVALTGTGLILSGLACVAFAGRKLPDVSADFAG